MLTEQLFRSNEFMVIQAAVAAANFAIGAFTLEKEGLVALGDQARAERLQAAIDKAESDKRFALSMFETLKKGEWNTEADFKKALDMVHNYNSLIDHALINSRSAFLPLGAVPEMRKDRFEEQ
jgi:hypothetical protein